MRAALRLLLPLILTPVAAEAQFPIPLPLPLPPPSPSSYVVKPAAPADTTVEVEYRVMWSRDKTRGEVEDEAIRGAQAEAIRRAVGVRVQSGQFGRKEEMGAEQLADVFHSIIQTDANGQVIASEPVDQRWGSDSSGAFGRLEYYWLKLRVTVARERAEIDPGFLVSVATNQEVYIDRDGGNVLSDTMVYSVRPTQDAYITIFTVRGDSVEAVFPNSHWAMRDNFVKANATLEFPSAQVRARIAQWRAYVPAGRSRTAELVAVVATKRPVPFDRPPEVAPPPKVRDVDIIEMPKASLAQFGQWLVRIPADQRVVNYAPYEVRRGKKP